MSAGRDEDYHRRRHGLPGGAAASWHVGREAIAGLDTDLLIIRWRTRDRQHHSGERRWLPVSSAGRQLTGSASAPVSTTMDWPASERWSTTGLARVGSADPLEVLRCLGGTELVAMAGAATEARRRSIPVLLDGFIATSAMTAIERAAPGLARSALAGHCSAGLDTGGCSLTLGKQPLLDLDLRLGEASGALVALSVVTSAAAAVTRMSPRSPTSRSPSRRERVHDSVADGAGVPHRLPGGRHPRTASKPPPRSGGSVSSAW
ncbi:MAG: nicotinate-nucleotide--dimethylbenzimidazole phosphoribosyltransferase [Acidimicrobiales bacterium]